MSTINLGLFDLWRPDYGGAQVSVFKAGTTTLATIYSDYLLTVEADNPITLSEMLYQGVCYGKWSTPLYVNEAVELSIDGDQESGIVSPSISVLAGMDASLATVKADGTPDDRTLQKFAADTVRVEQFGTLSDSSTGNTTILELAIGHASAKGGGCVMVPPGTWPFKQLSLPGNTIICGAGRGATTITSDVAGDVITITGDGAGLKDLTLDGINLQTNSIGVLSVGYDEIRFDECTVKRFDTGIHFKGGRRGRWTGFQIDGCNTGGKLHGDIDTGGGSNGDNFSLNDWTVGSVFQCLTIGLDIKYVDRPLDQNKFESVDFRDNPVDAIVITGARFTEFENCRWDGNGRNISVNDDSDTSLTDNKIFGLRIHNGSMNAGTNVFAGKCQDIIFDSIQLFGVTQQMNSPENNVLAKNSQEDALVTIAGDGTKYTRLRDTDFGAIVVGLTTDATGLIAYSAPIEPGEFAYMETVIIGVQRNDTDRACYKMSAGAYRPGSTLSFDNQVAAFTADEVITGQTSGATARVMAVSAPNLTLKDIVGTFLDNEQITGDLGGDALVDGTITDNAPVLSMAAVANRAIYESAGATGWNGTVVLSGNGIGVQVTGAASDTIEWTVETTVKRS